MEALALRQPDLIGREEELDKLKQSLDKALAGQGLTVFISGEAGIGKTRLVSELIKEAESMGMQVIKGWCLAESLEPLMPVKTALREAGMLHLVSGQPPPLVVSAYLMNEAGMLITKVERGEMGLDPDIFAGMLQAVGNFVQDSLSMMSEEGKGGLNSLGYQDYTILIQTRGTMSLAIVIKGDKSEFLIEDMKQLLDETGDKAQDWAGDVSATKEIQPRVTWFVESGKYDGEFLVDDPKIKQENLFDNVLLGIQRASDERPVLLFIDDLQWSDPSTMNLVHYLSRNTMKNKVLILGTYRPEDIIESAGGRTHQLEITMQNMSREGLFDKIELERLDRGGTEALINGTLGNINFDGSFFDRIFKGTEGVPFFVLEVVKLLVEDMAIAQDDDGAWMLVTDIERLDIPSKIYDVVKRRLDRLKKPQMELLECASVVGEEFESEVVGNMVGVGKLQLLKNLSEIEKTHKLVHYLKERYRFDHAKIREVLYYGIGEELRKEYHRMAGDMLAVLNKDEDEMINVLAYHYYEAGDERAPEYLLRAGDAAKERYANEEAIKFYENSLDMIDEEERTEVLEKLGDTQVVTGDFDKAVGNFLKIRESAEDNETRARMLRRVCDVYENKGEYDRALEILSEAKLLIGEGTAEFARICRSESAVHFKKGDYDEGLSLSHTALKIFEEYVGQQKDVGNALRDVGKIHLIKGEYDDALNYSEKSLAVMKEIGDQYGIAAALNNIAIIYRNKGQVDRALEFYEGSHRIFEIIGDKRAVSTLVNNIGSAYHSAGDLDKALEYHELSRRIKKKIGDISGETASLNNIGNVYSRKGETDKALECHARSLEIQERVGDKLGIALSCHNLANIYRDKGEINKALEHYERSLEIKENIGYKSSSTLCELVEMHLELGNVQAALEYAEKGLEASIEIDAKGEIGRSRRALGMVHMAKKEWDKAGEEFEKARTLLEEYGEKIELASLYYEHALLFKAQGEPGKAGELLKQALEMFEEMGMKLWEGKCREALGD